MHLLAFGAGPVLLVQLGCYPLLLRRVDHPTLPWQVSVAGVLVGAVGIVPWIGFIVAQTRRGRTWWSAVPSLACQLVGAGLSFTVFLALLRATRRGGEFVRTPKHQIVERGQEWRDQAYVRVGDPRAFGEAIFGIGAFTFLPLAVAIGQWLVAVHSCPLALWFLTVAGLSWSRVPQVWSLPTLGPHAPTPPP